MDTPIERVYEVPIHCISTRYIMVPAHSAAEAKRKALEPGAIQYGFGALDVTYGDEWAGRVLRTDENPDDWKPQGEEGE